jgi:hypothetical protein
MMTTVSWAGDNRKLTIGAIAPVCFISAPPKLIAVALVPIARRAGFFQVGRRLLNLKACGFSNP